MGGVNREEKWREEVTGAPEGQLGDGKGSHPRRGKLGTTGRAEDQRGAVARFPLPT